MDDRTLISLACLAREADALERDLIAGRAVHSAGGDRRVAARRRLSSAALVVGALGCVAVVAALAGWPRQGATQRRLAQSAPAPVAQPAVRQAPPVSADARAVGRESMVIALYRKDGSNSPACRDCWSLARWTPRWASGCDVTTIGRDELMHALRRSGVAAQGAVVLVGLSGPPAELPSSDAQAREAALCLLESPAKDCVASAVDVRVDAWPR